MEGNIDKDSHSQLEKWRSPLLLFVLTFFMFESLSGFALFFFGRFLNKSAAISLLHWSIGLAALLPYAIYQWRHYRSVQLQTSQLHYKLGLLTFFTLVLVIVSGLPLILDLERDTLLFTWIDLTHVVSSFAFMILLSSHLVLVGKLTLSRIIKKAPEGSGALRTVTRVSIWLPIAISLLILLLASVIN